jgi:PIN domain nuclease of toxin-antitoxin system
VKVLLDTHTLLWWLNRDTILSPAAMDAIANASLAAASAVSAYEIALKARQGKLAVPRTLIDDFTGVISSQSLTVIAIDGRHAAMAGDFPLTHRDPFDRLLSAQSIVEGMTLITRDTGPAALGAQTLW